MKKNFKNQKGITLIALVITIIVLLILAGVSISMISSQEGILNKATSAKETTKKAEAVEKVKLAVMASYDETGEINKENLKTELNKISNITPITEEITSLPVLVYINGDRVKITNEGDVVETNETKNLDVIVKATYKGVIEVGPEGEYITAISVETEVKDAEGKITYKYYIKRASDSDENYKLEYTGNDSYYLYDGLGEWQSYILKVEVTDENGNTGVGTTTGGTECFVAGTKVLTENGMENIEDIEVGQKVYALNIDTNERELKEVTRVFKGKSDEIYKLKIGEEFVTATPKHQFYIIDKGWVRAYDLEEGDEIFSNDGSLEIEKIEHEMLEEPVEVYNLTVEGYHNYLITKYELLVHNARSAI